MISKALLLLPFQFQNKKNWTNYLTSTIAPLDAMLEGLRDNLIFDIDSSTGRQLDGCGAILGLPRNTASDDDYRTLLRRQIVFNSINGTANSLIEYLKILLTPIQFFYYHNYGNIVCYLNLNDEFNQEQYNLILKACPAGVGVDIYFTINGLIILNSIDYSYLILSDSSQNSEISYLFANNDRFVVSPQENINDISKASFTQLFGFSDGDIFILFDGSVFLIEAFSKF